ncbi:hypothetical protein EC957_007500 [Mortierella hygrophila]|uniref:Uncharacterized protein n=1 Tax=Mortierella hygrophila TaxID=979708 RepID=A0A9P6K619_9FUNG|nr:hypothetical protein EC957_007500 [Mortierella hygrophila]
MDRYSKSSEGIHQGSKIARNSFGSLSSSHPTSTANHSTQTGNEHVRLNSNTTTSSNDSSHHANAHRGTNIPNNNNSNNNQRDAQSMATKDNVVQQQLQKSQFYQRGLHDPITISSTGKKSKVLEDEDDDLAAVATDEDEDIDRKLDPYMYDNVQYS